MPPALQFGSILWPHSSCCLAVDFIVPRKWHCYTLPVISVVVFMRNGTDARYCTAVNNQLSRNCIYIFSFFRIFLYVIFEILEQMIVCVVYLVSCSQVDGTNV